MDEPYDTCWGQTHHFLQCAISLPLKINMVAKIYYKGPIRKLQHGNELIFNCVAADSQLTSVAVGVYLLRPLLRNYMYQASCITHKDSYQFRPYPTLKRFQN